MSYDQLADGELAAVVTFLEMTRKPCLKVPRSTLRLRLLERPDAQAYRRLFRLVGATWLWFSRLVMSDAELEHIIHDRDVELFVVQDELGRDAGLVELDFRTQGECELALLGLVVELSGKGHGKWLLAEALSRSWRKDIDRVHVHTCSLDHPAALTAYRRAGFTASRRAIERFPDPRLLGILPSDCAPQIPLIGA